MNDKGTLITAGVLVVAVGAMVGLFAIGNATSENNAKTANAKPLSDKFPDLGQKHIGIGEAHANYNSNPPSSGPHYTSPTPWGISDTRIVDETLVHNAEHGGIVIDYRPDLPKVQIDQLKKLVAALPANTKFNETKVVLAPRPKNVAPISLVAWTTVLNLEAFDATKIQQFYSRYLDKGPELVP